jgi:hypothetical protein
VEKIRKRITELNLPAPAPIEQRYVFFPINPLMLGAGSYENQGQGIGDTRAPRTRLCICPHSGWSMVSNTLDQSNALRWTARSTAVMSPAASDKPDEVFTWIGIIMYMPPGQSPESRDAITRRFEDYVRALEPIYEEYGAFPHWAKVGSL